MKKLTSQQINSLFDFVKKHYVNWYDLQLELVDHLATDIEKIIEKNSQLSFEQARDLAFKKFGITGFYDIIKAKTHAMQKHILKLLANEFYNFFSSQKIFGFIGLWFLIFEILFFTNFNDWVFIIIFYSPLVFSMFYIMKYQINKNKKAKQNKKILLYENVLFQEYIIIFNLLTQPTFFLVSHNFFDPEIISKYGIIISFILAFIYLFLYLDIFIVPKKLKIEYSRIYQFAEN